MSFDVTPEISEETNYTIETNPRKPAAADTTGTTDAGGEAQSGDTDGKGKGGSMSLGAPGGGAFEAKNCTTQVGGLVLRGNRCVLVRPKSSVIRDTTTGSGGGAAAAGKRSMQSKGKKTAAASGAGIGAGAGAGAAATEAWQRMLLPAVVPNSGGVLFLNKNQNNQNNQTSLLEHCLKIAQTLLKHCSTRTNE